MAKQDLEQMSFQWILNAKKTAPLIIMFVVIPYFGITEAIFISDCHPLGFGWARFFKNMGYPLANTLVTMLFAYYLMYTLSPKSAGGSKVTILEALLLLATSATVGYITYAIYQNMINAIDATRVETNMNQEGVKYMLTEAWNTIFIQLLLDGVISLLAFYAQRHSNSNVIPLPASSTAATTTTTANTNNNNTNTGTNGGSPSSNFPR